MKDWFIRTEMLLGKAKSEKLHNAHILITGLGGVGAYAAEMLCRAGIGKFTLVDGDRVNASNRNRQLLALTSNEGHLKTELMAERLLGINPEVQLELISEFIRDDRLVEIISREYDYVVDAIDTLSPKVFLLYYGLLNNQRIISSMGAGGKFDPLQIKVADISKSYNCRLASILRKRLRKLGVNNGIQVVFSTEQADKELVEICDEQNKKSVVGTISYLPAMFGCICASVIIRNLISSE